MRNPFHHVRSATRPEPTAAPSSEPSEGRLPWWRSLSFAVTAVIAAAVAVAYGLWVLFTGSPALPSYDATDDQVRIDVLRLVFYAVAGVGGVVALTIAFRRQRLHEAAERREDTRLFNERFTAAAEQLSSEHAANRFAGVYAMARLADNWHAERQTCIDVLCAYMRMPYDPPHLPEDPTDADRSEYRRACEEREVRWTVMNLIGNRLRTEPVPGRTWHWCDFNFSGATLDGGDLRGTTFLGEAWFDGIRYPEGVVQFGWAKFLTGAAFHGSRFEGATVSFAHAVFAGDVVTFSVSHFLDGHVNFFGSVSRAEAFTFINTEFRGGEIYFGGGGRWDGMRFESGEVDCSGAAFAGTAIDMKGVDFGEAMLRFDQVRDWSIPPIFDKFPDGPPEGLRLPEGQQ